MGELGDIFGDEFENNLEQEIAKKRNQGKKVSTETLKRICYVAIHENGFKGESPRFKFDAGEVDHDVMLMEAPQNDIQKFRHKLGDNGVSLGMFHVGELMSCAFNDDLVELVEKIEEGEHYLVAGRYTEKTEMRDGEERNYKNISPVRGIVPLQRAKQLADDYASTAEGSSADEQAEKQQTEEQSDTSDDSSDSDDGGIDMGGLDDSDDSVPEDDIISVFQSVADAKPKVLQQVKSGDDDMLTKLTSVVNKNVSGEVGEERVADVFEANIEPIEGRGDDDEDDLGLDGIGDSDDSDESDTDTTSDDDTSEDDSDSDDASASDNSEDESSDDDGDPDDWF